MMLRKDSSFVVDRAVLKVKDQIRYKPVALDDLNEFTGCERFAVHPAQHEKSMNGTFYVAHIDGFSQQHTRVEYCGTNQQDGQRPGSDRLYQSSS